MAVFTRFAYFLLPACGGLALLATGRAADTPAPGVPPGPPPTAAPAPMNLVPGGLNTQQQLFIDEAGRFLDQERSMGVLALEKSSTIPLQNYARRIIGDQTRLQQELTTVVRDLHAAAPAASEPDLSRLARLEGAAFDRAYIDASISNHQAAIAEFQNQGLGGRPGGVLLGPLADWAQRKVPLLNDELTAAQRVAAQLAPVTLTQGPTPP